MSIWSFMMLHEASYGHHYRRVLHWTSWQPSGSKPGSVVWCKRVQMACQEQYFSDCAYNYEAGCCTTSRWLDTRVISSSMNIFFFVRLISPPCPPAHFCLIGQSQVVKVQQGALWDFIPLPSHSKPLPPLPQSLHWHDWRRQVAAQQCETSLRSE